MLHLDIPRFPLALLDEILGAPRPTRRRAADVPVEVHAHDDGLTLYAPLPGVDPEAIDLSLEAGELRIRAERAPRNPEGAENARAISSELPRGPVDLRMRLGFRPDAEGVRATYALGVLRVDVPRAAEERPHRIPVRTSHEEQE
jgi:HSP20 family protein